MDLKKDPTSRQDGELAASQSLSRSGDDLPPSLWRTTILERWAYIIYYIGNNGLSGFVYGPSQFQNLLAQAAMCDASGSCTLPFAGSRQSVSAIVLNVNGISFALQAVILLAFGAWADIGTWRPNILIFVTLVGVVISFAWLGVEEASKWKVAVFLYIMGLICAQCGITFWAAAFPGLARHSDEVRKSEQLVAAGLRSSEEHESVYSLARNKILNVAFAISSAAELVILAIMVGILKALDVDASIQNNTKAYSVLIAFSGAIWLVFALPWFFLEKRRPGLPLPKGRSFATIGFVQTYDTLRKCLQLKQTFLYFIFYFCMGDVMNTSVTVVSTIQYRLLNYSTLKVTYLTMLFIGSQMLGITIFWLVQKHFRISTKSMLIFNVLWIVLLTLWGLIGIWTDKFGFKNVWEIWVFQAYHGLLICPWYAYSQTMISEVIPAGQEFFFFALFAIAGKSSSFIGPIVSSAITSDTSSLKSKYNTPFAFLFALGVLSSGILFFVDVEKSRTECKAVMETWDSAKTQDLNADVLHVHDRNGVEKHDVVEKL